jgi:molybdate transport system substrate-binding protein
MRRWLSLPLGTIAVALAGLCLSTGVAQANPLAVTVAVAANFSAPMRILAADFEQESGYQVKASYGGTGQFYAQIRNGAPFDVLLAADTETPTLLLEQGYAVASTQFTYATGKLVLWSKDPALVDQQGSVLSSNRFNKVALANPKLAPYGAAAHEVLERLGIKLAITPKIVQGASIGQAFQFASSGNAQLGFVALSQVFANGEIKEGSAWIVPSSYYTPIAQDAILLRVGQNNPAAKAFLAYLQSEPAQQVIESFGYDTP